MSRTARRAAAKRIHILLYATGALTIIILTVLAVVLLVQPDRSGDDVSGSTDTVATSTESTNQTTLTDSGTGSVTDASATESKTDSAIDTTTDSVTNSSTDSATNSQTSETPPASTSTPSTSSSSQTGGTTDTQTQPGTNNGGSPGINPDGSFDFTAWNLILINPDHAIPADFKVDLTTVSLNGYDRLVDSRCADAFREMVLAAKSEGIILKLRSTYRGIALQTEGFNNKVQEYINKGYSKEEATKIAATIVAVPGTSEHHTGLAADITTPSYDRLNEGFENTDAFRWLYAHCAEYGFILRYPKDKTEITKIIYEPWHYRYVGKEAAKIIMSEGICYEEFVEKYGNQ